LGVAPLCGGLRRSCAALLRALAVDRGLDVGTDDAAVGTGSAQRVEVDVVVAGELAREGRHPELSGGRLRRLLAFLASTIVLCRLVFCQLALCRLVFRGLFLDSLFRVRRLFGRRLLT